MFFEQKFDYNIIEEVSAETLQEFCNENDLNIKVGVMDNTDWAIFAQWYGSNHGLNFIESVSFAYMVSLFMTGLGVSASTEFYLKEEQIEYNILDALNDIKVQFDDEFEQARTLFDYIFILYKEKITQYWKKTERMNLRVSVRQLDDFNNVEGKSKSDKLQTLLDNYY